MHNNSVQKKWLFVRPLPIAAFFAPVVSAPSGRALVPLLIIVGIWALVETIQRRQIKALLSTPIFLWLAGSSLLALLSATWSLGPDQSLKVAINFFGIGLLGVGLLVASKHQSNDEREATRTALLSGVSVAVLLLAFAAHYALTYDLPFWGKRGQHPTGTLSHAQTVIGILFIPTVQILWVRGHRYRNFGIGLTVIMATTFFYLDHVASNFAVISALCAFILVRVAGRIGLAGTGLIAAFGIIATPLLLGIAIPEQSALDAMTNDRGPWPSEIHRLHMWRFVTDAIGAGNFWFGFGADASRGFPGAAEKIMWGIELMPLHPHNGALQVWLELGLIGVVFAMAVPAMIIRSFWNTAPRGTALAAALLAAYMSPWLLSYGIWQSWWVALAWLAAGIGRGIITDDGQPAS